MMSYQTVLCQVNILGKGNHAVRQTRKPNYTTLPNISPA
jgi:hypothetical protein